MRRTMTILVALAALLCTAATPSMAPRAPYRGAIAIDADSGRILFADSSDVQGRPASVTKLMTFLLVLEDLAAGRYSLSDEVPASAYASSMEPSRVDLFRGGRMTVEDLLWSIMVKSANDAAVALAEYAAWQWSGRTELPPDRATDRSLLNSFIARMNRRAGELGMKSTRYASPNGLPPGKGEKRGWDVSTAADLALLARRLVSMRASLRYTSAAFHTVRTCRGDKLTLRNHNYFVPGNRDEKGLCVPVKECDGLKTGYTAASGSSIVLTAARNGRRVVVVVLSSAGRHEREGAAQRILKDALDSVSLW